MTPSGRRRGGSRSAGVRAVALVSLWLIGCASQPASQPVSQPVSRPAGPRPAAESAAAPRADSRFAPAEAAIAAKHGSDYSGFNLLERSDRALLWRLTLIDSAKHSIDLQYYVWFGDTLGRLMMDRVIKSADRGVKVRILFDDLNTMLHDMTHVEMRDELLARIDRHPNIQIRVFNPWDDRSLFGRGVGMASDFKRLNRRMHNKQMVVDNRVAIIGGRNLGDEYFGLNPEFNFHDLDVLGVGPVARQASQVFDRYWNSDWVRAIPRLAPGADIPPESELSTASIRTVMANPSLMSIDAGRSDWTAEIDGLPGMLAAGRSEVHTDSPVRDAGTSNHMPNAIHHLMHSAKSELLITNAYIIPDASFMADLRELAGRGVTVRILTNSLASHDVPAVNSHFEQWREPILETGAELYELRPDAAIRGELADIAPLRAEFVGLHTKAMVIDRRRAFVGSMNLDPRSQILNSEMGVLIDSPLLAEKLAERMLRDMAGDNSWQVIRADDGTLRWRSSAGELTSQPARSLSQRMQNVLFKAFPVDLY
ncbi:MAG: phospholipase D family protein [Candidatus Accumulibacter necessarius]|uniref:phospholipase D-like domain-containing protein n=1 Tax=Candidatus Accumulibacter necessarius TaxID=2954386 RepID=UPI002FC31B4F